MIYVINGSPKLGTTTSSMIVDEMCNLLAAKKMEFKKIVLHNLYYSGCNACGVCFTYNYCCKRDDLTEVLDTLRHKDTILLVFPIYNYGINSLVQKFLERLQATPNLELNVGVFVLHGSPDDYYSGFDLVEEALFRNFECNNDNLFNVSHKTTYDTSGDIDKDDLFTINSMINEMERVINESVKKEKPEIENKNKD